MELLRPGLLLGLIAPPKDIDLVAIESLCCPIGLIQFALPEVSDFPPAKHTLVVPSWPLLQSAWIAITVVP